MMKQGIAVYENRQRVERSRRGKDGRVRAGHVLVAARPAYGYRYVGGERTGTLEPDPDEAPIVRRIFRWCVDDGLTTYEIAKRLHAEAGPDPRRHQPERCPQGDGSPLLGSARPSPASSAIETYKGDWHWNKTRRVQARATARCRSRDRARNGSRCP